MEQAVNMCLFSIMQITSYSAKRAVLKYESMPTTCEKFTALSTTAQRITTKLLFDWLLVIDTHIHCCNTHPLANPSITMKSTRAVAVANPRRNAKKSASASSNSKAARKRQPADAEPSHTLDKDGFESVGTGGKREKVITVEGCLKDDFPVHCACRGGASVDVIKYLVEEAVGQFGIDLLYKVDNDG
eukprot:scaffold14322_cov87-Skeletonema_dohrnii-CCMP3373.AAC.1